jgi:GT2 family glycosyltransferase
VTDGARVSASGKFLVVGDEKVYVRGVTYGTFGPCVDHDGYPDAEMVEADFTAMARAGVNTVRTYTVPPRWLLDLAADQGLRILVGIPWEQHVAFLAERSRGDSIERRVRAGVRACSGHPAVLGYAVGNEIPASIVRWHGRRPVERFLARLYRAAKEEDPRALVTYVNYPSTEYLHLPFLDFVAFNVYLEEEERLEAYLARLQNLAGERPLVMSEIGYDSRAYGEDAQALVLDWQVRAAFRSGCAGAFVFAWTDEWHRGGYDVVDWNFGLVDRERRPKPALAAVQRAFADVPFPSEVSWPPVSVVVCTHNGARTLRECLDGLMRLRYPSFEVIVVDDGSTDESAAIAEAYPVRLVRTANCGLSAARNTGLHAATGELVAYVDDDTRADEDWLTYLAATFMTTAHAGVGGPNVAPPNDHLVGASIGRAPGGPIHVLVSDLEAEHIPGCNMAFRRRAVEAVGGFDPQFRVAGDDVDLCWRLQAAGQTLGFSPSAMVWHRPRSSIRAFFRQQRGYGRAEALLERKWPSKYNRGGQTTWNGRVYGGGDQPPGRRWRVYYGTWGSGLFQSIYPPPARLLATLLFVPEWYLLVGVLALATIFEFVAGPLVTVPGLGLPFAVVALAVAVGAPVVQAVRAAALPAGVEGRSRRLLLRLLTAYLHLLQPLARLYGRLGYGLTPWRARATLRAGVPRPRTATLWRERWTEPAAYLRQLEERLRPQCRVLRRGGDYDRWDLHAQPGQLAAARLRLAVEDHAGGKQLLRFRVWPRWSRGGLLLASGLAAFAALGAVDDAIVATAVGAALAACVLVRMLAEGAGAVRGVHEALAALPDPVAADYDDLLSDLERQLDRADGVEPSVAKARVP